MTQPLTKWQNFKGRLYEIIGYDCNEDWQQEYLWNKYVPMSRDDANAILTRHLPGEVKTDINFTDGRGQGIISMMHGDITETRSFNLNRHKVNPGLVSSRNKTPGYGRTVIRNEIEFFAACDVRSFNIAASSTAGGYVWARFGFLPTIAATIPLAMSLQKNLAKLAGILSPAEQNAVAQLVALRRPEDVWKVADLRTDIAPKLRDIFKKANEGDVESLKLSETLTKIDGIRNAMEEITLDNRPMPLGRALLAGTYWYGYFKMNSPEQNARASKYIGGWRNNP